MATGAHVLVKLALKVFLEADSEADGVLALSAKRVLGF